MWGRMLAAETEAGTGATSGTGTGAATAVNTAVNTADQKTATSRSTSGAASASDAAPAAAVAGVRAGLSAAASGTAVSATATTTASGTASTSTGSGTSTSTTAVKATTMATAAADESAKSFVTAQQYQDESVRSFASRGTINSSSGSYSYRPEASSSAKTFKASNTTDAGVGTGTGGIGTAASAAASPASAASGGRMSANTASRRLLVSHEEEEGEEDGEEGDDDNDNWSFDDDPFDRNSDEDDGEDDEDDGDGDGTPEKSNKATAAETAAMTSTAGMTPNRTIDKILGQQHYPSSRSMAPDTVPSAAGDDGAADGDGGGGRKGSEMMDRKQKREMDAEDKEKSPDKSGRRSRFAGTKSKSGSKNAPSKSVAARYRQQQQQQQNDVQQQQQEQTWQERSASSLLSNLGAGSAAGENSRHDDSQQEHEGGGSSWPALIDFEASIAGNEFADAADNMNDSSRSVGSIRSWEEHKRLEADVAFIVRNDHAERKKVHAHRRAGGGSSGGGGGSGSVGGSAGGAGGGAATTATSRSYKPPAAGMPPASLIPTPLMVAVPHAPIPSVVDTSPDKNSSHKSNTTNAVVDATPRVENKTMSGSGGGGGGGGSTGGGGRLKPPSNVVSKVPTKAQKEEPSSPVPPSRMQPRRVGAAAGTRSAVKAEMALAKRKLAAAVQKIEDEDDDNDNWDFDDDDDDGDDDGKLDKFDTPALSSQLHTDLVEYIASLESASSPLITSLNSVLNAELNTSENAAELVHYYLSRPNLLEYTVETELPRMDYLVLVASDQFVDKDDIRLYVESTEDQRDDTETLLWRAANQSLLADLIAALTGDDRLIRPSMMITAVAETCKFELDLQGSGGDGGSHRSINAICDLVLSIPSGSDDSPMLALGTVRARIRFVPEANEIDYSLVSSSTSLTPDNNPADAERLRTAALALERDLAELAAPAEMMPHVDQLSRTSHDLLRDQFLSTVSTTGGGLKSAWNEIDNATRVTEKLRFMKGLAEKAMPSLPTQEELDALEREQTQHSSSDSFPNHDTGGGVAGATFPRPRDTSTRPDDKTRSIFDRIADAPDTRPSQQQPKTPPQPASRAMGFLDRLVNEIDAPQERQSQFPRAPPPQPQPQPQHQATLADNSSVPTRPPPLIGGMLLSGFNKLAMAATAPDEGQSATFPRPAEAGDQGLRLYGDVERPSGVSYQQPQPSAAVDHHTKQQEQNPTSPITEPSQDGRDDDKLVADADDNKSGWSDEEEDLDLDDTKEEVEVPNELKTSPKSSRPGPAHNNSPSQPPVPEASSLPHRTSPPSNQPPYHTSRSLVSQVPVPPPPPSGSVCDSTGSFTFVSMTSLEKELPEVQNWIELEAVEDYDPHTGVIPTRKRWQPRRMRVTK